MDNFAKIEVIRHRAIIVLGMHRSGTSATTRALQVLGVSFGENLMPPAVGNNEKGFFEDIEINSLNVEALQAVENEWFYLKPISLIDVDTLYEKGYVLRAVELLRSKIESANFFAFKDPRVAKLLPFWNQVVNHLQLNVNYVMTLRHPLSVVKSLEKRDDFFPERSYLLWLGHVLESLRGSTGKPRVLVDYDRLIQSPDIELSRLADAFQLEINSVELEEYKNNFLDVKLRHTVYSPDDLLLDAACPPIVHEVFTKLSDVASGYVSLDDPTLVGEIEKWIAEFDRLKSIFNLADKQHKQIVSLSQAVAERDGQIVSLSQALAERGGQIVSLSQTVAERDGKIVTLGQAVAERDGQIVALGQAVAERDGMIVTLGQTVAERDRQIVALGEAVAERDGKIVTLGQAVAERDGQISGPHQALAEREGRIAGLNQALAESNERLTAAHHALTNAELLRNQEIVQIKKSASWKLTAPLRFLGAIFIRSISICIKIAEFIRENNGIFPAGVKIVRAFKNEGVFFVKKSATAYLQPSVERKEFVDETRSKIPRIEFDSMKEVFHKYDKNKTIDPLVKLIAFYLPQFHPFPENDEWWGKGFTEWTNVGKAKPNYEGHYQPHCPIHIGYYDLRLPSVMEEQARLAKNYGIYGFNYYFYWFGGKTLMESPLEMMLENKKIDMPFCLTWANENWSRRWDGQENDILIAQSHSEKDSLNFIRHLIKYFKDDRYIKIDGKPLLIIYRANIIPNIRETAGLWRQEAKREGFPDIYLVAAQTFGIKSPEPFGFDASMQFPPHTISSSEITKQMDLINHQYSGHIYSYEEVVANAIKDAEPPYKLFRTAMLSWDNTARKQNASHIFHGFSLLRYRQWLSSLINKSVINEKYSDQERFVFVNAWNEWAEGTHLEPDQKYGYGYLQATYDAISEYDKKNRSSLEVKCKKISDADCALIIHSHYVDVLPEIKSKTLSAFDGIPCDVFITVTSSEHIEQAKQVFPDAHIMLVENRGRDILPFIKILKAIGALGYKYMCKLHTKKSLYRNDGEQLRYELYEALLGGAGGVREIITRFDVDPKIGMIVPDKYLIRHTDHNMTFNWDHVAQISKNLKIEFKYDHFPAGSMFWFRPGAMTSLYAIDEATFEVESGLADGTAAHAIERLMCMIVKSQKMDVITCSKLNSQ